MQENISISPDQEEIPINHELEQTLDELGEYYYWEFHAMVNGNNFYAPGMRYPKVDERIAFKSIVASIVTELLA